jgi:septum site-determining protein MinD
VLQSPGIHVFFGLSGAAIGQTLNDYLWGDCNVTGVVYDVKDRAGRDLAGG